MSKSIDKRDEVLKLALEALEGLWEDGFEGYPAVLHEQAITAIREALASNSRALEHTEQPLEMVELPAQKAQQGQVWAEHEQPAPVTGLEVYLDPADYKVRRYESEQPAQQQVPVAWYDKHGMVTHDPFEGVTPLYTSSPIEATPLANANAGQRSVKPWAELTNNELQPICDEYRILFGSWVEDFARAIEAKLKEKNDF